MDWTNSINRLKTQLFASQAQECTFQPVQGGSPFKLTGFFTNAMCSKLTNASIALLDEVDFITETTYVPKRGDLLIDASDRKWRVKERVNTTYRDCDNVSSLRRIYLIKETQT